MDSDYGWCQFCDVDRKSTLYSFSNNAYRTQQMFDDLEWTNFGGP